MAPLTLAAQSGIDDPYWQRLSYFVGKWRGHETGRAGIGQGDRVYRYIMDEVYLYGRNKSTFKPQEQNPEGEVHQDWVIFSYDRNRDLVVAREFHIEGYVIYYLLDTLASSASELVFVSESSENAPPGLRARMIYRLRSDTDFEETFELAMPGQDFELYLTNYWKRKRFPW